MFYSEAEQEHLDHQPSTLAELVREQASWDGQYVPHQAWILSDFDTWERNPHYNGPANPPHPEDRDDERDLYAAPAPEPRVERTHCPCGKQFLGRSNTGLCRECADEGLPF